MRDRLLALVGCGLLGALGSTSLAGCGSGGSDGGGGGGDAGAYERIEVEPAEATLTVMLGGTTTQAYQAFGVRGGERVELTATCTFTVNAQFGSFTDATLTAVPHGGKTEVNAFCGGQVGLSTLVLELRGAVTVGAGTPSGAAGLFAAATASADPARTPELEYPLARAVSPANMPPVEYQWTAAGNDLFHLRLTSTFVAVDVYTSEREALLAATDWGAIIGAAAGDDLVAVVEGLAQAAPPSRFVGAPRPLAVSRDTVDRGAIYWWASSQGNIMTQTFGRTDPPQLVKADCTSCHSLSRAGTRLGYSRCVANDCGQLFAGFMKYDAASQTWVDTVDANGKAIAGSYTTFSPVGNPFATDDQSLAIVSMKNGTLALYDPDTGAAVPSNLAEVSTHGPGAPRSALMADWSPDGTRVIFASTPHPGQWIDLSDGALATMSYAFTGGQHVFGEPQFLVSAPITLGSGTYSNFFFPSFSPDGKLVVFNAARASWRNFTVARASGQRLLLADATGAWTVDLPALNGGDGDLDITWPHWAPGETSENYWLVFSSQRDYGHRLTAANTAPACVANGVTQCKQIWIAAISKAKVAAGAVVDPSFAPLWLPGQDVGADNISPFWTVPAGVD